MTVRRGDGGAERGLGRQIFGRFYRRGIVIPAIFVLATLATVVGARATTHQSAAQVAVTRSASASLQPSRQGAAKKSSALKARHRPCADICQRPSSSPTRVSST